MTQANDKHTPASAISSKRNALDARKADDSLMAMTGKGYRAEHDGADD
jgi:hypothetical protein